MRGGVKGNRGGQKGKSGRKSKAEEMGLAALLESAFTIQDRQDVFANLIRIAKGQDDKAAVSAASLLLGYAFGKPTEKLEHGGEIAHTHVVRVPPKVTREKWSELLPQK